MTPLNFVLGAIRIPLRFVTALNVMTKIATYVTLTMTPRLLMSPKYTDEDCEGAGGDR